MRSREELATLLREAADKTREGVFANDDEMAKAQTDWSEIYTEAADALEEKT